jgi:hypothetical protein
MRTRLVALPVAIFVMMVVPLIIFPSSPFVPILRAQDAAAAPATGPQNKTGNSNLSSTISGNPSGVIPNISGDWNRDGKRGGFGSSLSLADPTGAKRGSEPDIPYQEWARAKTLSERPNTGADAQFGNSTNPQLWCDPVGVPAVYQWPAKTRFVQTPDAVYILYEYGVSFRIVWLNSKHPDDPDPQWWGHSIGWYENGDTLVVDTVGFNDKTWLDEAGHPHSEKMHLIERYKRVDAETMRVDMTIDDPGAYTKPWSTFRYFAAVHTGFLRYQWACTVREVQDFFEKQGKPAIAPPAAK